jgi:ArsR family metal-binding transcriptional regulator
MLLKNYTKEICRPECNPGFQSVHCIAHLAEDMSAVFPYLNTVLAGFSYTKDPRSVTFKAQGKLISVYPRKIAINALKDEAEADKILEWLKREMCSPRHKDSCPGPSKKVRNSCKSFKYDRMTHYDR